MSEVFRWQREVKMLHVQSVEFHGVFRFLSLSLLVWKGVSDGMSKVCWVVKASEMLHVSFVQFHTVFRFLSLCLCEKGSHAWWVRFVGRRRQVKCYDSFSFSFTVFRFLSVCLCENQSLAWWVRFVWKRRQVKCYDSFFLQFHTVFRFISLCLFGKGISSGVREVCLEAKGSVKCYMSLP